MIGRVLRGAAVAIAVAAAVDPPATMSARGRPRVALELTAPDLARARTAHDRLTTLLSADFDVVAGRDAAADAVVVVGAEYPDPPLPERQRAFTVTVTPTDQEPSVRVSEVRAPREVQSGTLIRIDLDVDASNAAGATSTLIVRTGDPNVEVARTEHRWTAARERWRPVLDVTPLGQPPWRLHVEVSGIAGDPVREDDAADAMVDASERMRVLVYEPRLSWAGTFVRRALERDSRFEVAALAYPSRGLRVSSVPAATLAGALTDRTHAIVVGGLDRMTSEDAGVLSRFMRGRGGSVVLLPDSRADAQAIAKWLPVPPVSELLLEQAARLTADPPLAPLEASELLTLGPVPSMRTLARTGTNAPVVAVVPVGPGQLLTSGVLDAWRFRANDRDAFDRFWQSAIAGLAAAARPPIDVDVVPPVVAPGERAEVRVRMRRAALGLGPTDDLVVSATLGADAVRLWPGDGPDTFQGSFVAPSAAGAHRIAVSASDRETAIARFIVAPHARTARPSTPPLALLAESRGGVDVTPDDLAALVRRLREDLKAPEVRVERHPMRSLWWFAPFAACLGGEWWIRRRRGLR